MFKEKTYIAGRLSQFADVIVAGLSLWLSFFAWWLYYQVLGVPKEFYLVFLPYAFQIGFIIFVVPLVYEFSGLYQNIGFRVRNEISPVIFKSQVIVLFGFIAIFFVLKMQTSRALIIGFVVIDGGLTYLKEMLIAEHLKRSRLSGRNFRNIILVGYGEIVKKVIKQVEHRKEWGLRVAGIVVPEFLKEKSEVHGCKVLGTYDQMGDILRAGQYDHVIMAVGKKYLSEVEPALYACETQGMETWLIMDYFKTSIARIGFGEFQHLPMMTFSMTPAYSWQLVLKWIVDKIGALVGLALTSIIFVVVTIIIKITSPGPVFFKQKRLGLRGKEFYLLKFRSMVSNAEQLKAELEVLNEMDEVVFKIDKDPRITSIGKFIRKTSTKSQIPNKH